MTECRECGARLLRGDDWPLCDECRAFEASDQQQTRGLPCMSCPRRSLDDPSVTWYVVHDARGNEVYYCGECVYRMVEIEREKEADT